MYVVVNKTKKETTKFTGDFPVDLLDSLLNNGDRLIVISLYSNTIKIPFKESDSDQWDWENYPFSLINNE